MSTLSLWEQYNKIMYKYIKNLVIVRLTLKIVNIVYYREIHIEQRKCTQRTKCILCRLLVLSLDNVWEHCLTNIFFQFINTTTNIFIYIFSNIITKLFKNIQNILNIQISYVISLILIINVPSISIKCVSTSI